MELVTDSNNNIIIDNQDTIELIQLFQQNMKKVVFLVILI